MDSSKVRELGDAELGDAARKAAEQLFRIRFQLKLGQKEGVKQLLALKKDVARIKTIERERALGIRGAAPVAVGAAPGKRKKERRQLGAGEVG